MPTQTVLSTPAPDTSQQQLSRTLPSELLPLELSHLITPLCAALPSDWQMPSR